MTKRIESKDMMVIEMDDAIRIGDMLACEICDANVKVDDAFETSIITHVNGRQVKVTVKVER